MLLHPLLPVLDSASLFFTRYFAARNKMSEKGACLRQPCHHSKDSHFNSYSSPNPLSLLGSNHTQNGYFGKSISSSHRLSQNFKPELNLPLWYPNLSHAHEGRRQHLDIEVENIPSPTHSLYRHPPPSEKCLTRAVVAVEYVFVPLVMRSNTMWLSKREIYGYAIKVTEEFCNYNTLL
jgi:hypothetical protein